MGLHQRQGVDRSVFVKESGRRIWVDEKVRFKNRNGRVYDDIALEYVSNDRRNDPGWVCKPLLADYIAYAIAPLGICYMLPVPQLHEAWNRNGPAWIRECEEGKRHKLEAPNAGYKTLSVAVTPDELFSAMTDCLTVRFTSYDK